MQRILTSLVFTLLIGFSVAPAASAQTSLNLQIGRFTPIGSQTSGGTVINDRATGDVLAGNIPFLDFQMSDFAGPMVNGELLFGVGQNIEAGLGIGFYSRTVPSVYADVVNKNGTEIEQDLIRLVGG